MDYLREIRSQYTRDHIPGLQAYKRDLEQKLDEIEKDLENWECSVDCSECLKECPVTWWNTLITDLFSSLCRVEEDLEQLEVYGSIQ